MRLSQITARYYILIASILFILGSVLTLQVVKSAFYKSIDAVMQEEKHEIVFGFKHSDFAEKVDLSENVHIEHISDSALRKERFYNEAVINLSKKQKKMCRIYESYFFHHDKHYKIIIRQPISESLDLIDFYFFISTLSMIGLVILGTFLINYFVNKKLWAPFYYLLQELKDFQIDKTSTVNTLDSSIVEFKVLNENVKNLIERVHSDYLSQKEFVENSSHEFKTPLAVIVHQLDELLQSNKLGDFEMEKIANIYDSIRKLNHINKSITLLFKLENKHFSEKEPLDFYVLFKKSVNELSFLGESKNIDFSINHVNEFTFKMNKSLGDIFVTNLLSNAYKYSNPNSQISIRFSKDTIEIMNVSQTNKFQLSELGDTRYLVVGKEDDSQGLGLSIVKKIANIYGIKIYYIIFENLHCFRLEFPMFEMSEVNAEIDYFEV